MGSVRKLLALALALVMLVPAGAALGESSMGEANDQLDVNNSAWNYNAEDDVYWQVGVVYCATPETIEYESLGIYVPGAYMAATDNGDGTYTCVVNAKGLVNGYSASSAPIVIPVNTPGYAAAKAPTGYDSSVTSYTKAGFIYVNAGCRGRNNGYDEAGNLIYNGGAPWGVTDLKAAIRYIRYNKAVLPGNTDRVFSFGMSGGGAQSSLVGATGDSELYTPYLESIGAAMLDKDGNEISDAVMGSMCWCPITSLDYADEAYEWNMGQYAQANTRAEGTWTKQLSNDLAAVYGDYINELGLKDGDGNVLTLVNSDYGIYAAGTYYDYLLSEIQRSLNNFLSDTQFPYTQQSGGMGGMMFGGGGQRGQRGEGGQGGQNGQRGQRQTQDADGQQMQLAEGQMPEGMQMPEGGFPEGMEMPEDMQAGSSESTATTYQTAQEYIDSLNKDGMWVSYDAETNTAKILSVQAFVMNSKNASKSVGAFDDLNRTQAENYVFGNAESDALHFDSTMAALIEQNQNVYVGFSDWKAEYAQAYQQDMTAVDALGSSIDYRQSMYNPMYYVSDAYEGFGSSTPAQYWRIRTGITQGDTALTVEMNLALALEQVESVEDVDFETVWGQGHTMAERTGNSTDNFIAWVVECCA